MGSFKLPVYSTVLSCCVGCARACSKISSGSMLSHTAISSVSDDYDFPHLTMRSSASSYFARLLVIVCGGVRRSRVLDDLQQRRTDNDKHQNAQHDGSNLGRRLLLLDRRALADVLVVSFRLLADHAWWGHRVIGCCKLLG